MKYSLISNCCAASDLYRYNEKQFENPFMWNSILPNDLLNFIRNFEKINFNNFKLIPHFIKNSKLYGIRVDDCFNTYYIHYAYNKDDVIPRYKEPNVWYNKNDEYVLNKYKQRIQRFLSDKYKPCFVVITYQYDHKAWPIEKVKELLKLIEQKQNYEFIIISEYNLTPNFKNCKYIYEEELKKENTNDVTRITPAYLVKKHKLVEYINDFI